MDVYLERHSTISSVHFQKKIAKKACARKASIECFSCFNQDSNDFPEQWFMVWRCHSPAPDMRHTKKPFNCNKPARKKLRQWEIKPNVPPCKNSDNDLHFLWSFLCARCRGFVEFSLCLVWNYTSGVGCLVMIRIKKHTAPRDLSQKYIKQHKTYCCFFFIAYEQYIGMSHQSGRSQPHFHFHWNFFFNSFFFASFSRSYKIVRNFSFNFHTDFCLFTGW